MTIDNGAVRLPGRFRLVALDGVDSTNLEAKRLAEDGAPDFTVVWAREQTAGRGRSGRTWLGGAGNLYFSILLRPDYPPDQAMQLGFVAANAVADAVQTALPSAHVHVKWPNDVLVEGKKISGILMEGSLAAGRPAFDWLVLGVGVNVNAHPKTQDTHMPATSLKAEGASGDALDAGRMLETLAKRFLAGQATWAKLGFGPVRRHWLSRAQGVGRRVTARLPRETVEGVFAALDEGGALILRLDSGEQRRITAGDVFLAVR
ncbi:MAG: biotin--[acetyl-CoA-carboxylase] ligase [Alphaproteobacteria bacterium]|nr:biotin--[acetyl-CoA-carboxylase] ligase [Alphaproteobacteria bacterium]